jgi:hypothetical protein
VVAGGDRTILALWGCDGEDCSNDWGRRGSVFGRFGVPFRVGVNPEGFVDSHGRTVIAYDRGSTLEAITAEAGRPFGRPHRIVTPGRECALSSGGQYEAPVTASGNGHATFLVGCFVGSGEYVVRYTP